jgi:hypothetical protein
MKLPVTAVSQNVIVKRTIPSHYDNSGQWIEPAEIQIAAITNANIVPMTGNERASASLAGFDSNHKMFAGDEDITFNDGYSELQAGDFVIDTKKQRYKITFPGNFKIAYAAELKLEAPANGS